MLVEEMQGIKGIAIGISEDLPGRGLQTLVPMFRYLAEYSLAKSVVGEQPNKQHEQQHEKHQLKKAGKRNRSQIV
jgi:hypothetical protein